MRQLNRLWAGFVRVSERIGHFISKFVVTPILYYLLGFLFTLPTRAGDPLHLRPRPGSRWLDRGGDDHALERARSMY